MDDDSAELGEPVSPEDNSSTGSRNEAEMREAENSPAVEHEMGSDSDSNEEMEVSDLQTNNQVEEHGQYQTFESRIDSDNDMASETRESTVSDEQPGQRFGNQETATDRDASPMQSSVSEVSSENEQDDGRKTQSWERSEGRRSLQSDKIRLDSPKEERLDYGGSDDDDDNENIREHSNESPASDINVSSGSNAQLDRRKSHDREELRDVDNVSQAEDEEFTSKRDIHEGEVDDVSEQSGEESDDDRPPEPPPEVEAERKEGDDGRKDEDLDDVSDQSDTDLEEESKTEEDARILPAQVGDNDVQEDLDDVSDQSEDDDGGNVDVDNGTVNTSMNAPKDFQETVIPKEEQEARDLDNVSDSEGSEAVLDKESTERDEKPDTPDDIPPKATLEAVMDVHHHEDELDFEEELEERAEVEGDEKKRTASTGPEKGPPEVKPGKSEDKVEELESGEEGEMDEEEGEDGQCKDGEAGEIEDDEAEEGEVKDPDDKKPVTKPVCRFFARGQCTWGPNCRFLHPGVNDLGNYFFIDFKEIEENTAKLLNKELHPPPPPMPQGPPLEDIVVMEQYIPPPPIPEEPLRESAWERGIRQAKEAKKKVERRRELGIREEPQYILEETYDTFDMESAFHPDIHKSAAEQYGYGLEPDPEYNPQRVMRERRREPRPPPRHEHPPPQKRPPEPYHEPKFRENRISRKDQFGRDFNRRPPAVVARAAPHGHIPKRYPPEKSTFQHRERREERPTRPVVKNRKPADAWQDPWARTRSPKPKSKPQSNSRNRSGSLSSGSSVSRSRSRSYSSGSSRSSSASSYSSKSDSRSPSPTPHKTKSGKPTGLQPKEKSALVSIKKTTLGEAVKMGLKKMPGVRENPPPVKKMGLQLPLQKPAKPLRRSMSNSSISSASRSRSRSKSPVKSRPRPRATTKPRGRRRRTSSGSSHVSITSSKSSADSDHMYANLASPVSSSSSPDRISKKKTKVAKQREKFPSSKPPRSSDARASRPKAMVTVPSMEAFREPPIQIKKATKLAHPKVTPESKAKSTSAPAQMTSRNPVKHSTHKDIKLTLLNKPSSDGKKRYEVLGDGATKKVKPVAPVKPTTKAMVDKERRPVKPLQQPAKKTAPSAMVAPVRSVAVKPSVPSERERKRPPSPFKQREQPPAKMAHKAGSSGASKNRDAALAKKATISRREEILKQLKAVEDMIARKKAKMKN